MQNSVHSLQAGAWSKPMPFLLKRFEKLFLYNAIVSFYQQVTHATQESWTHNLTINPIIEKRRKCHLS